MDGLNIEKLKGLQSVLTQKMEVSAKKDELLTDLATKVELLNRIQRNFSENSERYSQIKEELKTAYKELHEAERMRERSEMRMGDISTQREYEALDKEIRAVSDRETQLKEAIEQLENDSLQYQERVEREGALIKAQKEELKSEEQRVKEETEHYKSTLIKLNDDERKITPSFDDEFFYKFQRIIKSLEGEGVVPLVANVCSSCHMILPHSFTNTVRQNREILFCPYCSKVLYYMSEEGRESASDSYADIIESFDEDVVQDMEVDFGFEDEPLDMSSTDDEEDSDDVSESDAMIHEEDGEGHEDTIEPDDDEEGVDGETEGFSYDSDSHGGPADDVKDEITDDEE